MDLRVLGPLEAVEDGQLLPLGGMKQRTVLALLIAHGGKPLSTDALIDGVYGEDAPSGARRSVQTYVSNLRRQLGDVIKPTGSGYVLGVCGEAIDAVRFEGLISEAASLGDPAEASGRLQAALAIWRGHPYDDVDGFGPIPSEVSRLNELRMVAVERRLDADLDDGKHAEVVAELESLTAAYPFRERFHGQHMLALYRSGRQAESLRAYEKARAYLVEEMGLDPSPELRTLEQQILEHDPALGYQPRPAISRVAVLVADLDDPSALTGTDAGNRVHIVDRHSELTIRAIENHGGEVFAQRGTAIYSWFDSASDAASAAEDAQWSLADVDVPGLRLRVAIDFGDVQQAGSAGIQGPPVVRAAALLASARGGNVLLAAAAHAELTSKGGDWQTRGLGTPHIDGLEAGLAIHLLQGGWPSNRSDPLRQTAIVPAPPERGQGIPGYEWRDRVGSGVFGVVHRAYQPAVGREVAIKRIRSQVSDDPAFIRRFEIEAQMVARLEHPHIVPLYDFWRDADGAFLVMRWMGGGSLADRLRSAPLGLAEASALLSQVGPALATAHRRRVVHRDIRPENILRDEDGNWYLSDFGVAFVDAPDGDTGTDLSGLIRLLDACLSEPDRVPKVASVIETGLSGGYADVASLLEAWDRAVGGVETALAAPLTEARNPYKGLAAFGELDADDFHGRGALTGQLVAAVAERNLVAVVGPSGIGKSSVVRAGLVPAVRNGALPGSQEWLITDMVPTAYPFEQLASALERIATRAPADLEERLRRDQRGLLRATQRYLAPESMLLLVIDQFEELFTLVPDEETRAAFLDVLAETAADPRSPVRIVLTIRADFFDRPLRYAEFGQLLRSGTVPASAPTDDELREIIANPATGVGVEFEPGLVDRIIADVGDQPGTLPLLEFALTRLFDHRTSDAMSSGDYDRVGGVLAALGRRAELAYVELSDGGRDVARQVFMRLVNVSESGRPTRRRTRMTELVRLGFSSSEIHEIVDPLVEARLLTLDRDPVTRGPTVEVAHEALLAEWPRMADWIESQQEDLLLHSRLASAVADWESSERAENYLLRAGRLEQHEAWTAKTELSLTTVENEFLELSRTAEDERRAQRRRVRRRVLAGFGAAALLASVLAVAALNASRQARANEVVAEGRALVASANAIEDDPQLALLLALEAADRLGDVPAATSALHKSIGAERTVYETTLADDLGQSSVNGDISPDGRYIAVAASQGDSVELHDIDLGEVIWRHEFAMASPSDFQVSAKFIGDGSELLVGLGWYPEGSRPDVLPPTDVGYHVFEVSTGNTIRRLDGGPCGPMASDWRVWENSDRFAASVGISTTWFDELGCGWPQEGEPRLDALRLDTLANETAPIARNWDLSEEPLFAGMSADGRRAIVGPIVENRYDVVDIDGGTVIHSLDFAFTDGVLTLNPDGTIAAVQGVRGLGIYDVETGALIGNLSPPESETGILGAGWSDDGTLVFLSNVVGEVVLYEVATGNPVATLPPLGGAVELVRVTPDAERIVTFGLEADERSDRPSARVSTVRQNEAGRFAPCAANSGPFYLVDGVEIHEELITVFALCESIDNPSAAFTYTYDTGELLAQHPAVSQNIDVAGGLAAMQTWTESGDGWVAGEVNVVDMRSGDVVDVLPGVCSWDWSDARRPEACATGSGIPIRNSEMAISPDATVVAIASEFDIGLAWNRSLGTTAQLGHPVSDADGAVYMVAVSSDGTRLVAVQEANVGEQDGTWLLAYSTDDFSLEAEALHEGLGLAKTGIRFSPDGTTLVGNTGDGVAFFDAVTLEQVSVLPDAHEPEMRNISYSADGTKLATTGLDGVARVWDVDSLSLVHEIDVGGQGSAVRFAADDRQLAVLTRKEGVQLFHLAYADLLDEARQRIRRGFTEAECRIHFPDGDCPTVEEMLAR